MRWVPLEKYIYFCSKQIKLTWAACILNDNWLIHHQLRDFVDSIFTKRHQEVPTEEPTLTILVYIVHPRFTGIHYCITKKNGSCVNFFLVTTFADVNLWKLYLLRDTNILPTRDTVLFWRVPLRCSEMLYCESLKHER